MSTLAQTAPHEAAVARGERHAFVGAYLGWMFDGYENFATVLVASFAVNDSSAKVPPSSTRSTLAAFSPRP
jgi:hypothetical protein